MVYLSAEKLRAEKLPEPRESIAYSIDLLTIWRAAHDLAVTERGKAVPDIVPEVARHLGYVSAYSDEIIREVPLQKGALRPLEAADDLAKKFDEQHHDVHERMGYSLEDSGSRKFLRQVMVWHVHEARRRADEQAVTTED